VALIVYIVLKYAAYAGWCYVALRFLRVERPAGAALALGLARQLMGVVVTAAAVFFAYFPLLDTGGPVFWYFVVFTPLRWVEWYLMLLAVRVAAKMSKRDTHAGRLRHAWVAGGVALSILTDLPVLFLLKHISR
jgi:hypothetical protein